MQEAVNSSSAHALCYEELLAAEASGEAGFRWVEVDENDACGLCYTSGTTGRPKVGRSLRIWVVGGADRAVKYFLGVALCLVYVLLNKFGY